VPFIDADTVLILYGDVPLIEVETLQRLLKHVVPGQMGLLTVELDDPTGYGRIVRDADGKVAAIVEHKDASEAQRAITEGNTGILAVPADRLADWMSRLSNNNAQGEYYLTDVIEMAVSDGLVVATEQPHDPMEVQGANDRKQLSELERHYQLRAGRRLMAQGVTLRDPARFDVRGEVSVGRDVLIDINVILEGKVIIEDDVQIGPNCVIKDSTLRKGVVIKASSHIEGAILGEGSDAGPFARLRPGTVLEARAHVGNFVELKNAHMGEGAKAGHLTYLGALMYSSVPTTRWLPLWISPTVQLPLPARPSRKMWITLSWRLAEPVRRTLTAGSARKKSRNPDLSTTSCGSEPARECGLSVTSSVAETPFRERARSHSHFNLSEFFSPRLDGNLSIEFHCSRYLSNRNLSCHVQAQYSSTSP
jgi:NDP-sugar pyrophosphorylase family protein